MKRRMKFSESKLNKIVKETVNRVLRVGHDTSYERPVLSPKNWIYSFIFIY